MPYKVSSQQPSVKERNPLKDSQDEELSGLTSKEMKMASLFWTTFLSPALEFLIIVGSLRGTGEF